MKFKLITFILLTITFGCTNDDSSTLKSKQLYGEWELIETFSQPPTGNGWSVSENSYVLNINEDLTFSFDQFENCFNGVVTITDNQISLIYSCNNFTMGYENPEGTFVYNYEISESFLTLEPENFVCFEGCKYKLEKR